MIRIFIDTFSSLDDLPKKLHTDPDAVLDCLRLAGRFSCFEMSEYPKLWQTIEGLKKAGRIVLDSSVGYPWTKVTVLPSPAELTRKYTPEGQSA